MLHRNRVVNFMSRAGAIGFVIVLGTGLSANGNPPDNANRTKDDKGPKGVSQAQKTDDKEAPPVEDKLPALRFKMKDIDGNEQDLRQYYGNVVLMVNVASRCGLTPQYEQLQAMYKKYSDRGFVILAFPANNFMGQEPESNDKIKQFCTSKYAVTFPMFAKVSVKGNDICDLYKYLTAMKAGHKFGGEIEWNFGKFLIGRDGQIIDRFSPRTKPDDKKLIEAVEKALAVAVPEDSPLAKKMKEAAEKKKQAGEKSDHDGQGRSSESKKE